MQHNFWLAQPYVLANQKLCYIQIYKKRSWEWLVNRTSTFDSKTAKNGTTKEEQTSRFY